MKSLPDNTKTLTPIPKSIRDNILNDNTSTLSLPSFLNPDKKTNTEDIDKIRAKFRSLVAPKILSPKIDQPPSFRSGDFKTEPDVYNFVDNQPEKPGKKIKVERLGIIYPENK